MPAANLTRLEAEERSSNVRVDRYEIALDLTRGAERFGSETHVWFEARTGSSTFIEATTTSVHEIRLNGVGLDPAVVSDGTRIRLDGLAAENELVVVSDAFYTNSGEGLHRFVDPVDDSVYLYTEFAVAEANRVFAVFDQPDLKASFQFTITAPSEWQVLSNAPTPLPVDGLEDGTAVWEFDAGPVISSYIAAIIAGPYAVWRSAAETRSGRVVPLGVFTRASLAAHAEPDVLFDTVRAGIEFYETSYGVDFPYDKYDQIFVPEYNWGAMENVGAVTFNEAYLFRSKVSDARKEQRTIVILHELSHMWFGNLVTMKWWNDLWLNESFATWTSTDATAQATPFTDAWATFASIEKTDAARQDQLPSTHPIVAEIRDLEDVEVNFDGITYDKGASVIKQLVAWVGSEAFYSGVGAYLRTHREGNATLRDLLDELETASGRTLGEWSALWLETAGVNTLRPHIETDDAGAIIRFDIEQTASEDHPTLRPHRLAVGFYDLDGDAVVRTARFELDVAGSSTTVADAIGRARPDLVLLNDDDLTYAKIRLDEASLAFALDNLDRIHDPVARILVWGSVWDAVRDAEMPASDFVRLVVGNIGHESQSTTRNTALGQLETALDRYVDPDARHSLAVHAADSVWALVQLAETGSDAQFQFLRAFIRIAETPGHHEILSGLLDGRTSVDGIEIDTDLRWELVIALAAAGVARDADIDAVLALDSTAKGGQLAATARAARPDAAVKRDAWTAVATDESLSNDLVRALSAGWRRARPASLLEESTEPYFAMLESVWAARSFTMAELIVDGLFPTPLVSHNVARAAREWLDREGQAPALRRIIAEHLSELERALAARAADALRSGDTQ
ncbi:aminopeptidase N [Agromyces atrinae]|uniref:aminopeptidase N n=1 Tax=Agromyces atrinae TaxID=592376 RepID=UPI001F57042F|nr:aminopeptidase N [Agromyces atrinae]MCI2958285.1 aminopeptidase N [Agromyces atrinae]